jgi:hypothetical protein
MEEKVAARKQRLDPMAHYFSKHSKPSQTYEPPPKERPISSEGKKSIEQLRAERLRREKAERAKVSLLNAKITDAGCCPLGGGRCVLSTDKLVWKLHKLSRFKVAARWGVEVEAM